MPSPPPPSPPPHTAAQLTAAEHPAAQHAAAQHGAAQHGAAQHPAAEQTAPGPASTPDAQYYRAILHTLLDIGVDTARLAHEQAQAHAANPATAPDPTIPFDRISRAIRRTVALAQAIAEPRTAPGTAPGLAPGLAPGPAPEAPPKDASAPTPAARRRQIRRGVEDRIARVAEGPRAEALRTALRDRLDSPDSPDGDDDDDDLLGLPIDLAIARVVDDLCASLPHPPGLPPGRVLRDGKRLHSPTRCPAPHHPTPVHPTPLHPAPLHPPPRRWPPPPPRPPFRPLSRPRPHPPWPTSATKPS